MHDWIAIVRTRLGALRVDPARAADIVDELAQHAAQAHAELVAGGMNDAVALDRVLAPLRERARVAAAIARADRPRPIAPAPPPTERRILAGLWRDLRYATRLLTRTPGFTLVVLLTLAIGIGANTAIFSVVNAVLLEPLPYANADRMVMVGERQKDGSAGNVGFLTFVDWKTRSHFFDDMALIRSWMTTLITDGTPERVGGMRVSANYFQMLGVRPAIGRDFTPGDDTVGGWHVIILSDRLWRKDFGADPNIVDRTIVMSDVQFRVVGVLPASYQPLLSQHFYQQADIWAPLGYDATLSQACRDCQHLKAVGVIKTGATLETARADIDAVHAHLREQFPTSYERGQALTLRPLVDELTGGVRSALWVLMAAVGFVLLIACANVANLMLARVARREQDLALRAALGASRAQLVRQLLIESALLSFGGCAAGLLLSTWAVPALERLAPAGTARMSQAGLDGRVLLFSAGLSVITALLFGLIPALRASRCNLSGVIHAGPRRTSGAAVSRGRRVLIAADVALAVVLLVGAVLMVRSVSRLLDVNPGFVADHVLTMQVPLTGAVYKTAEQTLAGQTTILDALRSVPGVRFAAAAGEIPLDGNGDRWGVHLESRRSANPADDPSLERFSVTPEYFAAMGIPLVRGRLLNAGDTAKTPMSLLVGEQTARTLWPNGDPIGDRVKIGGTDGPWYTIVGIVGDVRHAALAAPPPLQMYQSQAQFTDSFLTFVIRTDGDPAAIAPAARQAIWSVATTVPIERVQPLRDLVVKSAGPRQFVMLLLSLFSGAALLLTAIGIYGVIAGSVAERTREIGIRSALGASTWRIASHVLSNGMTVVLLGLATGAALALMTTKYLQDSLYQVSATDAATFAVVLSALLGVAALAHAVPIARALRVEPTVALKAE